MKNLMIALVAVFGLGFGAANADAGECRLATVDATSATVIDAWFFSGELMGVGIHGDGDTDLDLYVFDAMGNLVASSEGSTDVEVVVFYTSASGNYTILVVNNGDVYNDFVVCIE